MNFTAGVAWFLFACVTCGGRAVAQEFKIPPETPPGNYAIKLQICHDEAGVVTDVTVAESSGQAGLDEAAANAARGFRYRPHLENGKAVPRCLATIVRFELTEEDEPEPPVEPPRE